MTFAEPCPSSSSVPSTAMGKLSLGSSLELDYSHGQYESQQYHPSCHPAYHQSQAEAYRQEYQRYLQQQHEHEHEQR